MEEMSRAVIERAKRGDPEAFREIYDATKTFVYNVALRTIGKREDAEEVAQNVYLKVFKKLYLFAYRSSFKTWIYRVTVNLSFNYIRKSKRTEAISLDEESGLKDRLADTGPTPGTEMLREEKKDIFEKLLMDLKPKERMIITLRDIEGLSYEEIGRYLGININTVRSKLNRARTKFQELYRKEVGKNEM